MYKVPAKQVTVILGTLIPSTQQARSYHTGMCMHKTYTQLVETSYHSYNKALLLETVMPLYVLHYA